MAVMDILNQKGDVVGQIDLNDEIFGIEPHTEAMHEMVKMQLASRRQGTAAVKRRSDVSGGGRKPYRQKGTARARQGSIRAAQYRGGGVVFGPNPREYGYKVNKKVRRLALKSALSSKVADNEFGVIDVFNIEEPKTKNFAAIVEAIDAPAKTLFVVGANEDTENAYRTSANIPTVSMMDAEAINVYDLLNANKVFMTQQAVKEVEEALA